ncbi:MAG: hypothetical protein A2095_04190 [Sphingomonadales bacterium GWF1_63_6]|nr:MAG: hypothetical protein A2095_04190 [Sphingomonadales bacterium GWF1_63_6]
MIERVARALARRNYPGASDADIDEMWEGWADDATAAIQAMREPTKQMMDTAQLDPQDDPMVSRGMAYSAWVSMIDAAAIDTGAGEG